MELSAILAAVPTWIWVVGGIILVLFVVGERIIWDYEVKFPFRKGIGRGEVELSCGKRKGPRIKYRFELDPELLHVPLDIYVAGRKIYTITAERNRSARLYHKELMPLQRPDEGDQVSVRIADRELFRGPLVLD